jgi:hypothetical protein
MTVSWRGVVRCPARCPNLAATIGFAVYLGMFGWFVSMKIVNYATVLQRTMRDTVN